MTDDGAPGSALDPAALAGLYTEVQSWFDRQALIELLALGDSPIETISLDWLGKAGKRWRPFLAVCMFYAFRGGAVVPAEVRKVAVALECIHKASLIYDDIQDDDDIRYGEPTVHSIHGMPVGLTASLHLLGLGYRLIAECEVDPERRADMLTLATDGHCQLCLGQGAELLWMRQPRLLTPDEVLDIFRLKTAPSFDVVFRLPAIAGAAEARLHPVLHRYAEAIGTAYQVADDLDDFHGEGDVDDVLSRRPNIIMALAHQHSAGTERKLVAATWLGRSGEGDVDAVRAIIATTGAEDRARAILERLKADALGALDDLGQPGLAELLKRVAEMVFQ
jgi:geranylgeranyl diphosphate synthase, type II